MTDQENQPTQSSDVQELRFATLSDRFAATIVDFIILTYSLWIWSVVLGLLFNEKFAVVPQFKGYQVSAYWSTTTLLLFLYYLILEGVAGATFGKLFVGLRVVNKRGATPSLLSIFVRNILRFTDILLFPLLLTPFIEGTEKKQRFGDLIAGTVVIQKRTSTCEAQADLAVNPATTTRRLFCFLIDSLFFGLLMSGYILMIPASDYWLALVLVNLSPLLILLYFMVLNALFGGTPGKLILGLKVCEQTGQKIRFSGNFIRTILIPLDITPVSYLCAVLSPKRQRVGDIAGGSMVVKSPYRWYFPLVFLVCLVTSVSLGYWGWKNPKSFLLNDYNLVVLGHPLPLDSLRSLQEGFQCFVNPAANTENTSLPSTP